MGREKRKTGRSRRLVVQVEHRGRGELGCWCGGREAGWLACHATTLLVRTLLLACTTRLSANHPPATVAQPNPRAAAG